MIPNLPPTYVAHVVTPHPFGDVEEPHAAGEFGSMVGGFGVRVSLTYGSDGGTGTVIQKARARVFGSAGLVGPTSWLMASIEGTPYEEACNHDAGEILGALAEGNGHAFPPAVQRGAEFAVKALRRALGIAVHGMPADIEGGILVCRCIGVGDRAIRAAIRAGARDPEAIGAATGACTGCRSCRPDLMALIDEETRGSLPTPDEALHPAARICMATAGPVLRALGLPLEAAVVEEGAVRIRLGTPREDCCVSPPGAVAIARQLLRDSVTEDVRVELLD